ncbi:LytTR family DNA-binding domain-containing protein [Spirosoma fluviale]|uniref:LytTr DNA-binding domain-containing protein n=1 Tax=Spirosoma fluviale TaxID=1597977 RepID=A0A286G3D3_9BACT|nr:LytTR family DNA-binding domain-containing protein [Spirosoma fluviale]SOD90003.1 LytTr DNA-binding domain-containing protein [Spirosoma fluviale]
MINHIEKSYIDVLTNRERVSFLRVNDTKLGWQTRSIKDLVLIKGVRGYSWLQWADGSRQMMAYTIKYYVNKLPDSDFIRVHQNCIVNRNLIQKILITHRGPFVRLTNGDEIVISRRRWMVIKRDLLKQS